ncbi:SPFH domain-containing protein [Streptomyces sp. NPDC054933]
MLGSWMTEGGAMVLPVFAGSVAAATERAPTASEPTERQGPCLPGWLAVSTGAAAAGAALWLLWWRGVLPDRVAGYVVLPGSPGYGADYATWGEVMLLAALTAIAAGGLNQGRPGSVWVLTWCGAYRGTVRRTGLLWINPLLTRRLVDVALRHWRSRPIEAVDADGTRLHATVLLVWRVRDTARACFAVDNHVVYLRDQMECAVARVLSRLPTDDFRTRSRTLRDADHVGDALTLTLMEEMRPVGIEIISARPIRIDYAPEIAVIMRRRQLAALDARHRQALVGDVVTTVAETVSGLTDRGRIALDDNARTVLVKDLTAALCVHGRPPG